MERSGRTDAFAFLEEMRANDPELQAEYERLGPCYERIAAVLRERARKADAERS